MDEFCGECMETVTSLVFDRECSVKTIVDDMHSCECELSTNLMGHSSEDLHFEQGPFLVFHCRMRDRLELGYGVQNLASCTLYPASSDVNHPAKGECRVVNEVVFKGAADGDGPFHEGEIGFLNGLGGELRTQFVKGFCGSGDEDESRRICVYPM